MSFATSPLLVFLFNHNKLYFPEADVVSSCSTSEVLIHQAQICIVKKMPSIFQAQSYSVRRRNLGRARSGGFPCRAVTYVGQFTILMPDSFYVQRLETNTRWT